MIKPFLAFEADNLSVASHLDDRGDFWLFHLFGTKLCRRPRRFFRIPPSGFQHVFFGRDVEMEFEARPFLVFEKKTGNCFLSLDPFNQESHNELICVGPNEPNIQKWDFRRLFIHEVEPAPLGFKIELIQPEHAKYH